MSAFDFYELVTRLTGPIDPVGETNEDHRRLENLKTVCSLVDKLVFDIHEVNVRNAKHYENSRLVAARVAKDFLSRIAAELQADYLEGRQ